ncbi:MAG: hypothetical protein J6T10_29875 [Methanobrevibacter sp.]|nr:hypothetical protein [Methanobrevibacter sp.]
MSIKVPVVNTLFNIPNKNVYATVEGSVRRIGAIYASVNDVMKKLWPDSANPVVDPTIEISTPGSYTFVLGPGYYKFTMKGAGGGGAAGYTNQSYSAAAGGGGAAQGTFELKINSQEIFTFVCGQGGSAFNVWGQNRVGGNGGNGTVTSLKSNVHIDNITLNGGTGGYAFTANGNDHVGPAATAGTAGSHTINVTSSVTHSFTGGTNGTTQTRSSYAAQSVGYGGTINGGIAKAGPIPGQGSTCSSEAVAGGNGYLKIEPAVQYIYTSPITTSITLQPGTYYFEIVGAGGGGLGVTGASKYAYGNGGSAASGFGYFTVDTAGTYNIQVGTGGYGQSGSAGVTSTGTWVSGNGTESYIRRAADNFNIVTCGGGTGVSWHYDGDQSGGEYFNYYGQGGTYSTSLSGNYTLANGVGGSGTYSSGDYEFNYPYTYPTYFSVYGIGGYGRRLYGTSTTSSEEHNGHAGFSGMVKIYKYS